jgi:hypothetical protein
LTGNLQRTSASARLAGLDEVAGDLMISGGNVYSLAYADELVDVPVSSNDFYITDDEIPFYQMVIHGFIDYTGAPFQPGQRVRYCGQGS